MDSWFDRLLVLRQERVTLLERLSDIDRQEFTILAKEKCPLTFNEDTRIIQWNNKCLKLGKKMFHILCTLYFAENHELLITDLEEAVWGEAKHGTIKTAISRLDTLLNDTGFPFYVESTKNEGGDKIEISDRKGHRIVKIRPALAGFRLQSLR